MPIRGRGQEPGRLRRLVRVAAAVVVSVLVVLVQAAASGQTASPGDMGRGREVFAANCAMCHGTDAAGMAGMHPSLRGAVQRLTLEGMEVAIRNGRATQPPMPAWEGRLSDRQIQDVIAYIASLPPGPRNFGPDSSMMDGGMMGGAGWGMAVAVLAAAVVVALVVAAVAVSRSRRPADSPSAREILDRRYAAGELTHDEYLRTRDDLEP